MSSASPAAPTGLAPTPRSERSLAPDLARGAVLLFIALANVASYNFARPLNLAGRPVEGSALDHALDFLVSLFVDQRSYPMFAMLFGYGMATMLRRGLARGQTWRDVRRVLLRRNVWLIVFGVIHATLLFLGDILAPYGVTGLIVLLLLTRRTRTLVWWAVLTLIPLTALFALSGTEIAGSTGVLQETNYLASIGDRQPVALILDIVIGLLLGLVGPMLIGVLVSRAGWLDRPWDHVGTMTRIVLAGLSANIVLGLPYALIVGGYWDTDSVLFGVIAAGIHALVGVTCGLAYLCLFGLVAGRVRDRGRPGLAAPLGATGERSLTCYLLQSVFLAPLMSPWGLGWGATNSSTENYGLALGVWLVTVIVATLLAAAGQRGPFEVLLRRLTYGRPPRGTEVSLTTS